MAQTSQPTDPASEAAGSAGFSIDIAALPVSGAPVIPQLGGTKPASTSPQLQAKQQQLGQKRDGSRPMDIFVGNPHSSQGALEPASPPRIPGIGAAADARRSSSPFTGAASPGRLIRASNSPRHLSPATSQIFERDVQEPSVPPSELSPAIPNHIHSEDHIPPVLEASSLALTDKRLGPDEVEIVQHTAHVPAALTVAGSTMSDGHPMSATASELGPAFEAGPEDGASTYGAVDPSDPRRLSFISFADIVNADHQEVVRESQAASLIGGPRSASPLRSPLSSFSTKNSPPMSAEVSPTRGGAPSISSGHAHNEVTIETMRQTLQKTGNTDIGSLGG